MASDWRTVFLHIAICLTSFLGNNIGVCVCVDIVLWNENGLGHWPLNALKQHGGSTPQGYRVRPVDWDGAPQFTFNINKSVIK